MTLRPTLALLCSGLLLSACVTQSTYNQQVQKTSTYQKLDEQLKADLAGDSAQIEQLQNLVKLTLANGKTITYSQIKALV